MKYSQAGVYEVPLSATDECSNETVRNREVLVAKEVIAGDNVSLVQEGNEVTINVDVCGALDECQTITDMKDDIDGKQDELTAGQGITIENNVISSEGTTYTAGDNITIENDVISATDTTYTAGDNITIENNVISADEVDLSDYYTKSETYSKSESYNKTEVDNLLDDKQDKLTAGQNIQIAQDGTISATDTTYEPATQQANGLMSSADKTKLDGMTPENYLTCANVLDCQSVSDALDAKQDLLTAGDNISITQDNTISADIDPATDTDYGTIKMNPNAGIVLNEDGQIIAEGLLGKTTDGGYYAPNDREPRNVSNYCLLITDIKGAQMTNSRSFAVVSGANISLKTAAAAGATEYHVSNTYVNRIRCKVLEGGFAAKDEATSGAEQVIPVVSVTIGGEPYTVSSAPDDPTQDIIITTESTLNPDSEITSIRAVGTMGSYSTAHVGNGIASLGGGRCLLLGSTITKDGAGNECGVVASDTYVYGNGSAVFGRYHILNKNRAFLAGVGHDTTNARGEGVSAVGMYSLLDEKTLFAVGNGFNATNRGNAFEVSIENGGTAKVNFIEAKNGKLEFADSQDIAPTVSATNWGLGTGGSIEDYDGTPGFATTDVRGTTVSITAATGAVKQVTAGETLQWSFKARKKTGSETGKLQLNLLKCNASGGSTSNNLVHDGTAASYTTEWVEYTGSFTVPDGMEYVRPRFTRTNTGAGSDGGYEIKDFALIQSVDSGIILTSPNGTKFKLQVADDGTLSTVAI